MPSQRFKLVVALMSVLTVATYVAEPVLVAHGGETRKAAPDFALATVDGSVVRLSELANGSLVLVEFMATWCFPCRQQIKELAALRDEFEPQALTIISVDEEYSVDPARVVEFRTGFGGINGSVEAAGWFFAVDTVEEHVGLKYGAAGLPTMVLVDAQGAIAAMWSGSVSAATLRAALIGELRA